jgi:uncharacterized membrane protein (UPF0127 family)
VSNSTRLGILVLIAVLALAAFYIQRPATPADPEMIIGQTRVRVEIADTPEKQIQGLSGRLGLSKDTGMLFEFAAPGQPAFWMKGMNFPLDFIWIANGRVVEITPDVPHEPGVAEADLQRYIPVRTVDSLLEISGGWAALNGVKVGDDARLVNP